MASDSTSVTAGFRHAFDLLVTNGARKLPFTASVEELSDGVLELAFAVVQLSKDMRAPAEWRDWIILEFDRLLEPRVPDVVLAKVRHRAHELFGSIGHDRPERPPCDLFIVYVPEDRLPIAAPVAVELTKRGIRVGFAEFEVEDLEQLKVSVGRGIAMGAAGLLILGTNFDRRIDRSTFFPPNRLLIVDDSWHHKLPQLVDHVYRWITLQASATKL